VQVFKADPKNGMWPHTLSEKHKNRISTRKYKYYRPATNLVHYPKKKSYILDKNVTLLQKR